MEGWVEVCHDEIWQGVCDSGWNDQQARVVCRQLGFSTEGMCVHDIMMCIHDCGHHIITNIIIMIVTKPVLHEVRVIQL